MTQGKAQGKTQGKTQETLRCARVLSLNEIRKHDQPEDLWIVFYNKVYDVSHFAGQHPGGVEVLYDCGGVDGTKAFEDVGHSNATLKMLEPYKMGVLRAGESRNYVDASAPTVAMKCKKHKQRARKRQRAQRRRHIETLSIMFLVALILVSVFVYWRAQSLKWAHL